MNKTEAKKYLDLFEGATGVRAIDGNDYMLSSIFGDIRITFDLKGDTIFTKLFNPQIKFEKFGFNPYSGKRNYHTKDDIYRFLYLYVVTGDIVKSDTAMTAIISQSIFDKTGENKMYDIAIYTGGKMTDSVTCIDYMECTRTAMNLNAAILRRP